MANTFKVLLQNIIFISNLCDEKSIHTVTPFIHNQQCMCTYIIGPTVVSFWSTKSPDL